MQANGKIISISKNNSLLLIELISEADNIFEGQLVDCDFWEEKRTKNQNNLYHLFIRKILKDYKKYDPTWNHDTLHEYFKEEFLRIPKNIKGTIKMVTGSTAKLNKVEFVEFMENCFMKAMDDAEADVAKFRDEYETIVKTL